MIENHAGDTGSVTLVQPTIYYETDDFTILMMKPFLPAMLW